MRTQEAVEIFGSKKALAQAIGLSENAVYHWGETVPKNRQVSVRLAARARADAMEAEAARVRTALQEG